MYCNEIQGVIISALTAVKSIPVTVHFIVYKLTKHFSLLHLEKNIRDESKL